jgi:transposase
MAASDGLSDAEWAMWEPLFPPERGRVGQPAKVPTRLFLDALLWMTGEGARWRALPERFGPWNTIWRRFARWRDQGVFEAAFAVMAEAGLAQERVQRLDSTVIRAHQHAAGARRTKGGRGAQPSRSGAAVAASRPSSTFAPTRMGCRSPSP